MFYDAIVIMLYIMLYIYIHVFIRLRGIHSMPGLFPYHFVNLLVHDTRLSGIYG